MSELSSIIQRIIAERPNDVLAGAGLTNNEIEGLRIGQRIGLHASYRVASLCGLELKNFVYPGQILDEPTDIESAFNNYSVDGKSWYESIGEAAIIPRILVDTAAAGALYESSTEIALDGLLAVARHDRTWAARISAVWTLSEDPLRQEALARSIDMLVHKNSFSVDAIESAKRIFEIFGNKEQTIESAWSEIEQDPIFNRLWKTQKSLFNLFFDDNNPISSIEELRAGPDSQVLTQAMHTLSVIDDPKAANRSALIREHLGL
jgi:hypothetical protein